MAEPRIRPFTATDSAAVVALWRACGLTRPWNDPERDIARKLGQQAEGFLIAEQDGTVVGSVMAGYDGHRGWVNYLAVSPQRRMAGIGRALMRAAETYVAALGAPKLNLQVRADNEAAALFYEALGYRRETLASFGKRLVDDAAALAANAPPPKPLVLASRNGKKLKELEALLPPLGYQLHLVSAFSDHEPAETGASFIENALIKARHAATVSGLPAIADDSGLEVDALDGAPGVYSARYAGEPSDDAANNAKLLAALREVPEAARGARFVSALAWMHHGRDPTPLLAMGLWPGRVLEAPRGSNGFGYDPLFWLPDQQCSAAELPAPLKNRLSHRARALRALLVQLGA